MDQQAYWKQQGLWPIPGNINPSAFIENLFSTYLYTGTGAAQTITNGIQLGDGYVSGGTGGSGLFNGTTGYLSVPTGSALNLSGDFTVECYVYQTNSVGYQGIFGNGEYPSSGQVVIGIADGNPIFYMSGGSSWATFITPTTIIPNYSWTHMAVTCSGSTFTMWINGVSVGTSTYSGTRATPNSTSVIGRLYPVTGGFYINGYLSNLRVVKGTALYTSTFTPSSSALTAVSGTQLLCLQGTTPFVDNSTNALTITVNGGTTASTSGPFPYSYTAGKGGLTWIKSRSGATGHRLTDTVRGATKSLASNSTDAEATESTGLTAFGSTGFTIGADTDYNTSAATYCSWTFREQPKFFDVVTYTGNGSGSNRTISHSLGSAPGMIILKVTNLAGDDWYVYHRSIPTRVLALNSTNITDPSPAQFVFGNGTTVVAPTSTNFTIGSTVNPNGYTFVAYLFAHDAGGFGTAGTDNVITCGSFTTDANGNATVNLGYEPQYLMYKSSSAVGSWTVLDTMRGFCATNQSSNRLAVQSTSAESAGLGGSPSATGFYGDDANYFAASNTTYIYMAIRRPMAVPTVGTSVFMPVARTGNGSSNTTVTAGFPVDMIWNGIRNFAGEYPAYYDRLRGNNRILYSNATNAEFSTASVEVAFNPSNANTGITLGINNNQINGNGYGYVNHFFRRASGFFDEVCYTGTGSSTTQAHNLGVIPQMIIYKPRTTDSATGGQWAALTSNNSGVYYFQLLNSTLGNIGTDTAANYGLTASTFNPNIVNWNTSGVSYVSYLFATCPGVSKVGSYTGTGATQTIDCGFTGGARYVLIKRTDSAGNWWVWDTARGMISGTDPKLALNDTAAETNANWVYTATTGFQIVTTDATVNVSGGSYIFLAIA